MSGGAASAGNREDGAPPAGWMREQPREEVPAAATERQRRAPGVAELRRSELAHGASIVISAGSVLDFGGGTEWAPATVAIVNAANCGGLGGGGVDGAITSAGGPQLAADRRALPILEGTYMDRIVTGGAVLTGPGCYGTLHAAHVIHAVGPNYLVLAGMGKSMEDGDGQLREAYRSTMRAAAAANIEYLGFSLLSAGIFRGARSLEYVLRLGVEAVVECAYPGLKEVHLVAFMGDEQQVLLQLLESRAAAAVAVVREESVEAKSPSEALRAEVGSELAGVRHETELLRDEFRDDIADLRKAARCDNPYIYISLSLSSRQQSATAVSTDQNAFCRSCVALLYV